MRVLSKAVLATLGLSLATGLQATPWVKTDDQFLQQSIQLLANAGHINIPVNTWPLMWQPIMEELQLINTQSLTQAELFAYLRVQSAASFAQRTTIKTASLQASSDPLAQAGFGQQYRDKASATLGLEVKGENWTSGIVKNLRHDSYDANSQSENQTNWDGSYGAYTAGNWVLLAAVHQQWWGPAIHSSFNFNNQQRPAKSLQLSRLNPKVPLHESLSWLGPVHLNVQYGEFSGTAPTRHATYAAARLTLKPIRQLEVGVNTKQLKPKLAEQLTTEPYSNLLPQDDITTLGLDLRYHLSSQTAVYAELSSQRSDEQSNGWLVGSQYHLGNQQVLVRLFAEYQHIPEDYSQWLFIQPGSNKAPVKNQWVAGAQISTARGQAGYISFGNSTSQQTTNAQPEWLTDAATLQAGYQHPVFGGLVSVDYQLQRGKQNTETVFEHAAGLKIEWRW